MSLPGATSPSCWWNRTRPWRSRCVRGCTCWTTAATPMPAPQKNSPPTARCARSCCAYRNSGRYRARRLAEAEAVSIRLYEIIYRLIEDIEKALKGMLEPEFREVPLDGQMFSCWSLRSAKLAISLVVRCLKAKSGAMGKVRLHRGDQIIYEGEISSLKREKDDVREVRVGLECGISFKNFSEVTPGDWVECFLVERM